MRRIQFLKGSSIRVTVVILLLLSIGLLRIDTYGISTDEGLEIAMVTWNYRLIADSLPIPGDLEHYGTVFNFSAQFLYDIKYFIENVTNVSGSVRADGKPWISYDLIRFKHYVTFILSMVTYIAVAGIVGRLIGRRYAWLGPIALFFLPRFWGHSFFNPKDIPFAAMFTLGTYMGGCLIERLTKLGDPDIDRDRIYLLSILYGVLVGLVTGVRIAGLFLLGFVVVSHFIAQVRLSMVVRGVQQFIGRFIKPYALMVATWSLTTTLVHPAAWSNPVVWMLDTLAYMSSHEWSGTVLFSGAFIKATDLPWTYLPKWFLITTPIFMQIAVVLGIAFCITHYKKMHESQKALLILVLMQIFFFPTVAIVKQSTVYDGIRQFLFIVPAVAVLGTLGVVWIYKILPGRFVPLLFAMFVVAAISPTMVDMVQLNPYEYIYFNRAFGGLASAQNQFETDYWGLSMRAGMEWINEVSGGEANVVSSDQLVSSALFAEDNVRVISYGDFVANGMEKPFYYVAAPRWDYQEPFPECSVEYAVLRQSTPLTIVKQCD